MILTTLPEVVGAVDVNNPLLVDMYRVDPDVESEYDAVEYLAYPRINIPAAGFVPNAIASIPIECAVDVEFANVHVNDEFR